MEGFSDRIAVASATGILDNNPKQSLPASEGFAEVPLGVPPRTHRLMLMLQPLRSNWGARRRSAIGLKLWLGCDLPKSSDA